MADDWTARKRTPGNFSRRARRAGKNDADQPQRHALPREIRIEQYARAMFSTGHDAANRAVFRVEDAPRLDLVGLALHGPKKAVDKALKGLAWHA